MASEGSCVINYLRNLAGIVQYILCATPAIADLQDNFATMMQTSRASTRSLFFWSMDLAASPISTLAVHRSL